MTKEENKTPYIRSNTGGIYMKTPVTIYVYRPSGGPMVDAYIALMQNDKALFVGRTNEEGFVETEIEHDEKYDILVRVRKNFYKEYETMYPQILIKRVSRITSSVGLIDEEYEGEPDEVSDGCPQGAFRGVIDL